MHTTHLGEHRLQLAVTKVGLPRQLAPTVLLEVESLKRIQELVQLQEDMKAVGRRKMIELTDQRK